MDNLLFAISLGAIFFVAIFAGAAAIEAPDPRDLRLRQLSLRANDLEATKGKRDRGELIANVISQRLNLKGWLGLESARERLVQAGKRSPHAESQFLVARLVFPILMGALSAIYVFGFDAFELEPSFNLLIVVFATFVGFKLPEAALNSEIKARREKIRDAFPDALDLMVMMAESGKSIDQTFRKIAEEIEPRCKELAEELQITLTERAFLPDPRQAYENLGARTQVREIKSTCIALTQAEEHGTPMGQAFRALAKEGRENRMHDATAKAASVAALIPVPVLFFFLIPLMLMALFPAAIEYMEWK